MSEDDKSPFDELYDTCLRLKDENKKLKDGNIELWSEIRQHERQVKQLVEALRLAVNMIDQIGTMKHLHSFDYHTIIATLDAAKGNE